MTKRRQLYRNKSINGTAKPFDFAAYPKISIALKISYLGWDYSGLTRQSQNNENTVEFHIFQALKRGKLIESEETCEFSRCGRTDRGVSAVGNILALTVRKAMNGKPLPYMTILNRGLPDTIRVLGWARLDDDFDARYSCRKRTYRYYFPTFNMDIERMKRGAKKLEGTHDFRNFAKLDPSQHVKNVVGDGAMVDGVQNEQGSLTSPIPLEDKTLIAREKFLRTVQRATIDLVPNDPQLGIFTVEGSAFLYHQVRCMTSMLLHIGSGLEEESLIDYMLDISKCPNKPQYDMALDYPLEFAGAEYDRELEWIQDDPTADAREKLRRHVMQQVHYYKCQARIAEDLLNVIDPKADESIPSRPLAMAPLMGYRKTMEREKYVPIMKRNTAPPISDRLENYVEKVNRKRKQPDIEESLSMVS